MPRRWSLLVVILALVALGCKETEGGAPSPSRPVPVPGYPSSMVALGDSITAGFGSCLAPASCHRNSWATGDGTPVYSHYRRLVAANPAMRGHATNLAVPGIRVADLPTQASKAVNRDAEYVTILIGANDACSRGIGGMTTPADFRSSLDEALTRLKEGLPDASILIAAIPDIYRVWEVAHTNKVALAAWKSGVCPNLLANPTSTAPADVERRAVVRDRVRAYNGELEAACLVYGDKCRFNDKSATFNFKITALSAIDFFHPNASGQNELARLTYPGSFSG